VLVIEGQIMCKDGHGTYMNGPKTFPVVWSSYVLYVVNLGGRRHYHSELFCVKYSLHSFPPGLGALRKTVIKHLRQKRRHGNCGFFLFVLFSKKR